LQRIATDVGSTATPQQSVIPGIDCWVMVAPGTVYEQSNCFTVLERPVVAGNLRRGGHP